MSAPELTFDDGPDPAWTPAVLDALDTRRATFFMLADRATAHPGVVEDVLSRGHGVELHAVRHVRHTELCLEALEAEAEEGVAALRALGARPTRWRPPWGVTAPLTWTVAARHGLTIVGWTHDTEDWRGDNAETMLPRVRAAGPGDVVLAHDGIGPGARRDGCAETVRLVELLAGAGA